MAPTIISVDGNIGSGKSTFVRLIGEHFKDDVCILKEPVDEWENIKDRSGKTIIQNFYESIKKTISCIIKAEMDHDRLKSSNLIPQE